METNAKSVWYDKTHMKVEVGAVKQAKKVWPHGGRLNKVMMPATGQWQVETMEAPRFVEIMKE